MSLGAGIDWTRWTAPLVLTATAALVGTLAGLEPALAIVAALGVAFALVVFGDLTIGVVLFTLLTFFELLPDVAGPAFSFTKVAGLILALSWVATLATRADAPKLDFTRAHPAISYLLALFLAWTALSYFWAEVPLDAAEASYRFALNAVLLLIVYTAVRSADDVIHVYAAFAIGAAGAAAYGLFFALDPEPYGEAARLSSQSQNANELASTLVTSLVLSVALLMVLRRSPLLRPALFGAAAIAITGVLLTVSRAGMISLGVAVLAAVILSGRWRAPVTALALVLASSTVLYFAFLAEPEARERITTTGSGTGRTDIWTVGWRMVEDEPLRGVGSGNFDDASIHYLLAPGVLREDQFIVDTPKVAHNVFLGVLAELGIVGLALFLAVLISLIVSSGRAIREFSRSGDVRMEILARAQLIALIAFLASLFFASDEFKKQLWLLLALGPALLGVAHEQRGRDRGSGVQSAS